MWGLLVLFQEDSVDESLIGMRLRERRMWKQRDCRVSSKGEKGNRAVAEKIWGQGELFRMGYIAYTCIHVCGLVGMF